MDRNSVNHDYERDFLEPVSSGVIHIDLYGTIVYVNDFWVQEFNFLGSHIKGISIGANYLDACLNAIDNGCTDAENIYRGVISVTNETKAVFNYTYSFYHNHEQFWIRLTITKVKHESFPKLILSFQDVTSGYRDSLNVK